MVVSLKQRGHGIGAQAEAGDGDGIQSEGASAQGEAAEDWECGDIHEFLEGLAGEYGADEVIEDAGKQGAVVHIQTGWIEWECAPAWNDEAGSGAGDRNIQHIGLNDAAWPPCQRQ